VLWLSGRDYTVVGVLAPGFDFELPVTPTLRLEQHDLWTVLDRASPFVTRRDVSGYEAIVRRAPGVSLAQAQAAVDAVGQRLARAHDSTNRERTFRVTGLQDEMVRGVRRPILAGCVGAIVTLVIALVNLMTLALGRLSDRQTELAIRQALGAGTERLRRQLLTEHGVLAAIGGLGGFALATVLVRMLAASEAAHLPRVDAIRFDGPVRLAALALTALIVLVLTLLPVRLGDTMGLLGSGARAGGRSTRRFRQWLVAGELALAVALTTGSALLGLSLTRLFDVDPGFAPDNVLAARVSAYSGRYPSAEHVQRFFSSVIDTLERAPGIARAAAGSSLPLSGQMTGTSVMARGRPVQPGSRLSAGWQFVTPGYFAAIGMPVRRGRDFSDDDRVHAGHVTIVNEELARSLFPNEDPVGKLVAVGGGDAQDDWHEIVGVVGDVRHHALTASPEPRVYDLLGDHWGRTLYVVVRSRTADAAAAAREVRVAVASLDPEAPVFETATMAALVERSAAPHRLAAGLAGGLALAGLLLALIGVYAVAAASVAERAREIGIRAALGARPIDLLALVVRDSLLTAIVGGAMGAAGSLATSRLLASQLFGVRPADVGVVVPVVGAVLMTIAVMATLPAARRAAGADPLVAIRAE
jgi:predicted permease